MDGTAFHGMHIYAREYFWPIKETVQIDMLSRDCEKNNQGMFLYKNVLSITPLALIDDCLGFSLCGPDTVEENAVINTKL